MPPGDEERPKHDPPPRTDGACTGTGDEPDWEGERRALDSPWLLMGVLGALGAVTAVVVAWAADAPQALGLGAAWAVWMALSAGLSRAASRTYASEIGVPPARLPVLARRIRQERIPRDPAARRAMARLVRRQRRQLGRSRWIWPLLSAVFLATSAVQWQAGRDTAALLWVMTAALLIPLYLSSRRALQHVRRVGVRLGQEPDTCR
ncbi:hypothetical protein [Streptomyces avicenniae]|uniref:hypothetical protein n=1 Tax=Streptomyces avicenniae TaxID=500153 RepID=UPI00069C7B01|nr:hypothetical protein [Streptomyces avicenniae]